MLYNCVVFSFIVLIYYCNADEIRTTENHHDIFTGSSSENWVYYTAQINKPLELRFQDISISNGSCEDFFEGAMKLEPTISNSTVYVPNVTYSMSTQWTCRFMKSNMTNLEPKYYYLFINLHVKGAKSVEVTVNDKVLSFNEANISVPYDGHVDYLYEDGERVHIVCRNPQRTGDVYLEYSKKDASNITNTTTLDIQLHSGSDHSYVDCVYITQEPNDTYVYRVMFIPKKLVYTNESKTLSDEKMSSLLLVSSIGAGLVVLVVTGTAYYRVWMRIDKNIEIAYGDLTKKNDNSNLQTKCDNQYDECHYNDGLPNKETYYDTTVSVENMGLDEPNYTEIDYSQCKPKVAEAPHKMSYIYDEPYL